MLNPDTIEAVLFDSDGVLIDTERLFFEATRRAFAEGGVELIPAQWARWFLGEAIRSREIGAMLGIPDSRIDHVITHRDTLFWALVDDGVPIFPGVVETLETLGRSRRLAIVTGATRVHFERVHATTNLRRFFETEITADDYPRPKPHPHAYLTALQRLGITADRCLAVEDSPRGAIAAVAAGIRCAVIPTFLTDRARCPRESIVLERISQVAELLGRRQ